MRKPPPSRQEKKRTGRKDNLTSSKSRQKKNPSLLACGKGGITNLKPSNPAVSHDKQKSRANALALCLAEPAGFEPANAGTKTQCLTTWRRLNTPPLYHSYLKSGSPDRKPYAPASRSLGSSSITTLIHPAIGIATIAPTSPNIYIPMMIAVSTSAVGRLKASP